jgi:general secretion pathway protein L
VVPFEIEAQLPFDLSDAVFDFRQLTRRRDENGKLIDKIDVFASIAKLEDVRARIDLMTSSGAPEPEMIVPGAFALGALIPLVPELASAGTLALVDLGATRTELIITVKGEVSFVRTLSVGTAALPGSAPILARELRQSLAAWRQLGGEPVEAMYLVGGGAMASGAEAFLAGELGVTVGPLPMPRLDGITPEIAANLPRHAKALALAMSLSARQKVLNLRQGALAFERGYGFLREKIPVLAGLGAVIIVSSLFATWAEMRSLSNEHEVLEDALATVSKDVLGEETRDPSRAIELLDQGPGGKDDDPLPQVDAFDVLVQLADALPGGTKHDIEEIDVQRAGAQSSPHVNMRGVVPKVTDAEDLATKLKEFPCFQDVKIQKTAQQIGGDGQKYAMEWDLRCASKDKKPAGAGSATGASSAAPKSDKDKGDDK